MPNLEVKCVESRRIADDDYTIGLTYTMTKERYDRYPAYFTVVKVIEEPKQKTETKQTAKTTATKRVAKTEDKSG